LLFAYSAFGELALLYSAPRAATVRAITPCKLWVMERAVYNTVKRNFTHEVSMRAYELKTVGPCSLSYS